MAEIVGDGRPWTVLMISELSIALQVDARDPEVGVPQLALDHDERDSLVRHLDRVGVPQLVRREPPAYTRCCRGVVELFACG